MRAGADERFGHAGILLLTACALVLRFVGLGQHLPHALEDDSLQIEQASVLRHRLHGTSGGPGALPTQYPLVLPALGALVPTLAADPRLLEPVSVADHLAKASERVLRMRWVVALVSALAVPASWALARRFLGSRWALVAAAFVALGLLPLVFAQQARPHGGFLGFSALALVACLRLRERGGWSRHAQAGLAAGLALGTLHFGLFLLPPLVAAHALAPRRSLAQLGAALATVALCAWLAYPSLDGGFAAGGDDALGPQPIGLHPSLASSFHGGGAAIVLRELASHDPALLALAVAGLLAVAGGARGARARRDAPLGSGAVARDALVVGAFALPFATTLCAFDRTFARFLLPLYPVLALAAALAVRAGARLAARGLARRSPTARAGASVACVALALALPSAGAAAYVRQRLSVDTVTLAARWLEEHVRRDEERISTGPFVSLPLHALPLGGPPEAEWMLSPWERYLHVRGGAADERLPRWDVRPLYGALRGPRARARIDAGRLAAELDEQRPRWVVLTRRPRPEAEPALEAVLARGGVLAARFDRGDERAGPLPAHALGRAALLHLLRSERGGPTVEIYRLPS